MSNLAELAKQERIARWHAARAELDAVEKMTDKLGLIRP